MHGSGNWLAQMADFRNACVFVMSEPAAGTHQSGLRKRWAFSNLGQHLCLFVCVITVPLEHESDGCSPDLAFYPAEIAPQPSCGLRCSVRCYTLQLPCMGLQSNSYGYLAGILLHLDPAPHILLAVVIAAAARCYLSQMYCYFSHTHWTASGKLSTVMVC